VVLRAASRAAPPRAQGNLSLSFSKGIVFDANASGRLLERLRKVRPLWRCNGIDSGVLPAAELRQSRGRLLHVQALRWEVTPVITGACASNI
jgi:hypothetical protein